MRSVGRSLTCVGLLLALAGAAVAQSGEGLSGALDRQQDDRALQQYETRRQNEQRQQDLQRQLDQGRLQQSLDQQLTRDRLLRPCLTPLVRC